MSDHRKVTRPTVIAVGGANGERVIQLPVGALASGRKYSVSPPPVLAGGSAVNQSCRLLALGYDVMPIAPVADDVTGRVIAQTLRDAAKTGGVTAYCDHLFVEGSNLSSPISTVVSSGSERTILNEFPDEMAVGFPPHCRTVFEQAVENLSRPPVALLVGHVHADRPASHLAPGQTGELTRHLIDVASQRAIPTFANFGRSQYELGLSFWEPQLRSLDCFQMDIHEMREFVASIGLSRLDEVLAWFSVRCTVVITLDRAGAIARLKNSDAVIFCWPYDLDADDVVDTTGAGDACLAGIVDFSLRNGVRDPCDLEGAIEQAMLCAAYACNSVGGATNCPSRGQLAHYAKSRGRLHHTETRPAPDASSLLRLLDRLFT